MLSYWLWLCVFVFAPILILLALKKDRLLKYPKTIIMGGVGSLLVAVPWDHFAIRKSLWSFPESEILGAWLFGLPVEEWFFIFFIGIEITMLALLFAGGTHE